MLAPFLSEDPIIADLLSAHAHWGSEHQHFLHAILTKRGQHATTVTGILTDRERDVLVRLRTTMTADEIATDLGIAYPTVKTHIRAIYRKLGVTTRRHAIRAVDRA